jgi:hypothetical protein
MVVLRFGFSGYNSGTPGYFGWGRSQSERPLLNLAMPASSSVHLKAWFSETPSDGFSLNFMFWNLLKFWSHLPISVKINHKSCMETNVLYVTGLYDGVSVLFDIRNEA